MIVPMKKISLVVLENERREALKNLRKLGVLHVEEVSGSSEELSSYKLQNSTIEKALGILTEIKLGKKEAPKQTLIGKEAAFDIAKKVIALTEEKKTCFDRITADSVELERFAKWGGVNPLDFAELSEKGLNLALYEIPGDKYALIGEEARTIVLGKDKSEIRFVLVSEKPFVVNERPAGIPAEAYQVPLPRLSTADLQKEISDSKKRIVEIEAELKSSVQYRDSLKSSTGAIAKDIELENLYSGMGIEEKLSWITGFVPVDSMAAFEAFAKEQKWAYAASDPTEDDNVPTKLKNNKLVSLIYPLTDFLGTVPGYHEYDISGWFLAFFTIFFGMIFGDGGYGALVTAVALIFILKSLFGGKRVPPMLGLVLLLGVATMVWGAVTCTWFGLQPEQLPDWIVALSVPPISNAYADVQWIPFWTSDASAGTLGTAQNLQIFCFTLALIQLCVAHLKGMARYITDKQHRLKFLG
ncbi:ATPase, partial [Treponema sp.]|uniref:ATPase n=1 Tax=Treponema sp. TaxID=166 RepID=UPI0025FA727C